MVKSGTALEFSTQSRRQIKEVQLSVLDPDEIKALSVCEVTETNFIDRETNQPRPNSLSDPRMGPCLKGAKCLTCGGNVVNCPGHFGHMVLSKPVYHFGFIDTVKKILSCVCHNCSKLKGFNDANRQKKIEAIATSKNSENKLNALYKLLRGVKKCHTKPANPEEEGGAQPGKGGCGAGQPNYVVDDKETIGLIQTFEEKQEGMSDTKSELTAEMAHKILAKMSDEDIIALGFDPKYNKPKNLLVTVLPVAPPQVRPTVDRGGGMFSEDDLTYQYQFILKANISLKQCIDKGEPSHVVKEWLHTLQFYVTTFSKNDYPRKSTHKNGRPIKSIRDRISSKEGRIRGNLMGKRVDFSARTVISPDPNLALDELGVPRSLAANLTFPEQVTQRNHDFLTGLVKKDTPWRWPGAKYVKKKGGEIFDLRIAREINLEIGDIVERHIMDGDYVLFNRQPSLHKMSMMAHRIRVLPFSSFRLNLSVTKPYNADFDGDEMNMHVPQSYETKAELKEICHIPKQIVSPKANQPVMGLEQDALTGIALFSKRSIFLTLDHVMNLMMFLPPDLFDGNLPEPAILKPQRLWTGKQVLSMVFPKVNLENQANGGPGGMGKDFDKTLPDLEVLIQKGEILKGIIDNKTVGQSRAGLVHTIWLEHGTERTRQFLTDSQRVVNNWFASHAFTVGISDTIADQATFDLIAKALEKCKVEVSELINMTQRGDLEFQPGKGLLESFEQQVNQALNESRDSAGNELLQKIDARNNILHMVNAGSKGKKENLCQILACVGQQNVEGKRIPFGFAQRSLPHFSKYDYGPRSKGFVENCYLKGLTPDEFYFHTMGGREGLIDTACKTSETGYIQRKLVKALEDCMVHYDNTVRDAGGNVIQFLYGEDGMAGEFVEACKMELASYSDDMIMKKFEITLKDNVMMDEEDDMAHTQELDTIKADRDLLRVIFPDFRDIFFLPVCITRLIKNSKSEFKIKSKDASDLQVKEVLDRTAELIQKLYVINSQDRTAKEANGNATALLAIYIRFTLSPKKLILIERLNQEAFNWLLGQIETLFHRAKAHPGENVGAIAAQSISEPTTQMTLNTFHMAGISSKNVTLGVPRIKELINNALNIGTPSLTIYLKDPQRYDENFFHDVAHNFSYTKLRNLVFRSQIFFDPDPLDSIIEEHESFILRNELFYLNPVIYKDIEDNKVTISPWVLRIMLSKDIATKNLGDIEMLVRTKITQSLRHLEHKIRFVVLVNNFLLAISEEHHPVIRILMVREKEDSVNIEAEILKRIEREILDEIPICGLERIKRVYTKNKKADKTLVVNPIDNSLMKDKADSFYYETDGSNLLAAFNFEYVDHTKTTTNVVPEVLKVLGIEAARKSLLEEIRRVISYYGIYINYRHLALLTDVMTHRGYIMPINRNGINRIDSGPLRKCSFEETLDMILAAAAFGTRDRLTGVSEKIMLGQLCKIGTGAFDIIIDVKKLSEPRFLPDAYIQREEEIRMEQPFEAEQLNTPMNINTPQPMYGGATPGLPSTYISELNAAFTPQYSLVSPVYSPAQRTPASHMASPRSLGAHQSPLYFADPGSVLYAPQSPLSSHHSPSYSPSSLHYNPTSPHYSATNSPSLSSSGGGRIYSPSSPAYSNSPRYSPGYSPRSPGYNSPSASNTPSSQNPNTAYTPNTPSYNRSGGVYVPTSPAYDPSRTIHEDEGEEEEDDEEDKEK